ncbi:L-2-amino-thiazoline-4-carboxylic acid hydrolase [Desulfoscipio gibsoniae]|uniref:Hydrocarbon binding protein (Contains V4R domain) n=1 Tax=Desulfoscipio gibsoniae DSM 7213 TaxID=767817 RepID=R4KG41_9FIRM|nr:L-2-amino-thiazoline-4-carboxylic acid hydrolase [Desulfoscipio gibsoniae]AGL00632.1 hypothetical protein Desgi_1107 [Desulfoscipio gibsoniae DSM 7213]
MSNTNSIKLQRNWKNMILISHGFFHCWRQTVEETIGQQEAKKLVQRFWELVGQGTAEAYLKKNRDPDSVEDVVQAFARASEVMGETVRVEKDGEAVLLVHDACPWIDSYRDYGSPGQCQLGCDRWFGAAVEGISPRLRVETTACQAAGDQTCARRFTFIS